MRWSRVHIDRVRYVLGPERVSTRALEDRLLPLYRRLGIPPGQVQAMTGIVERRLWPAGASLSEAASRAAAEALAGSGIPSDAVDVLAYGSVCREDFEPATACHVAGRLLEAGLPLARGAAVYDVGNACLGVLHGMVEVANRIELGQARAGLVVGCESAREIIDAMTARMLDSGTMEAFRLSAATITGGSAAVAVLLTGPEFARPGGHALHGGVFEAAPEHHALCRWGLDARGQFMATESVAVLHHGVDLARRSFARLCEEAGWAPADFDRTICHQVGSAHRDQVLPVLGLRPERDYVTYDRLGNTGACAVPVSLALADEEGFVRPGDRVGLLGIGSGLNCLMLAVRW